jgi:hypothetical protein
VQPYLIVSTASTGVDARRQPVVNIRPVNSVNVNIELLHAGHGGGDHAFKIGGYWKDCQQLRLTHTGGFAVARFPTELQQRLLAGGHQLPGAGDARRQTDYDLLNISLYAQDTYTPAADAQLGVRYDYNHDQALASLGRGQPAGAAAAAGR